MEGGSKGAKRQFFAEAEKKECTCCIMSAVSNNVPDNSICHCKMFFFVTELLLYRILSEISGVQEVSDVPLFKLLKSPSTVAQHSTSTGGGFKSQP